MSERGVEEAYAWARGAGVAADVVAAAAASVTAAGIGASVAAEASGLPRLREQLEALPDAASAVDTALNARTATATATAGLVQYALDRVGVALGALGLDTDENEGAADTSSTAAALRRTASAAREAQKRWFTHCLLVGCDVDSSGDGGHIGGSAAAVEAMKFDAAFDASAWQRFRCVCAVCCVVVMVVCAACHVSDAWLCRCDPLAESIGALLAAGRVRAAIMVWRRHSAPALARPVVRQLHRLDVVVSTWRARAASRVVGNHCVRMR